MEQHYLINAFNLLFGGPAKRDFYFIEAADLHQAFQDRVQSAQPGLKATIGRPGTSLSPEVKELARAHIFLREVMADKKAVVVTAWEDDTRWLRKEPPPGWVSSVRAPRATGERFPTPRATPVPARAEPVVKARSTSAASPRFEAPRVAKAVIPAGSGPEPVLWRPPEERPAAVPRDPAKPRRMMLGRYLHAQGLISLEQLIDALRWQRAQRPLVGAIALRWGFLNVEQICSVLRSKEPEEFFCEAAVRLGYLTELQRLAVLGRQRKMQRPIGSYFVERGFFTEEEMERHAERARQALAPR